jgi:hypothetical protein
MKRQIRRVISWRATIVVLTLRVRKHLAERDVYGDCCYALVSTDRLIFQGANATVNEQFRAGGPVQRATYAAYTAD